MTPLAIDLDYLQEVLIELLRIPSPAGFTDEAVRYTLRRLEELEIPAEITRRGAIRADLKGAQGSPDRAIVTHLDTLGAITSDLKDNYRYLVEPLRGGRPRHGLHGSRQLSRHDPAGEGFRPRL